MTITIERDSDLERDIAQLRDNIRVTEQAAALKRESAQQFLKELKVSGLDPLNGTSTEDREAFERVDIAFKAADELFETGAEFRRRLDAAVQHASHEVHDVAKGDIEHPSVAKLVAFGERFVASEQYAQLKRSGALEMSKAPVKCSPVQVASRQQVIAALFPWSEYSLAAQLIGEPLTPTDQRLFPPVGIPARRLRVRDLVFVTETDTDLVEYVEETTRTDAAAETAYGTLAPEATYVYTVRQVNIRRIPHALPVTKGNLADAAQLRGFIDGRLIYGVGKRLDGQMISGDGVGENLRGILNTAGIGTQALGVDSRSDAFHKAMTVVRVALEDEPDGFVLHPNDYQDWALEKGTDGHYLTKNGPQSETPTTIWGLPVVVNTVVGAGTGIVGAWRQGATLWVRAGVDVAASDSHTDFFTKGLVMLLAEGRFGFAAVQPKAFASITGI